MLNPPILYVIHLYITHTSFRMSILNLDREQFNQQNASQNGTQTGENGPQTTYGQKESIVQRLHSKWRPQRLKRRWRGLGVNVRKHELKKRKNLLVAFKKYKVEKNRAQKKEKREITKLLDYLCKTVEKMHTPPRVPKSRIMSRKYDTAKHVVLHILATTVEKKNVIFDKEASDKKKEIFGYDWSSTCIWTGATTNLSVDHIFPIRGAYGNRNNAKTGWVKEGLRGSDSQWNTIMVYKTKNAGFKIFNHKKTHGWKKDISWQKLTSEELDQCTQQERGLYVKLQKWRMYARERGASFCWQFEENTNREIEKLYVDIYKLLEERTEKLDVKLVPPSRVHDRLASWEQ